MMKLHVSTSNLWGCGSSDAFKLKSQITKESEVRSSQQSLVNELLFIGREKTER